MVRKINIHLGQKSANFFCEGLVNIFNFVHHKVSVRIAQLYCSSVKAATDNA